VNVISLKKYLDMPLAANSPSESASEEPFLTAIECYRAMLLATGKEAAMAYSSVGRTLEGELQELAGRLGTDATAKQVKATEAEVEARLESWGRLTAKHLKSKADDAKEILLVLARTAEAVGNRDEGHANRLHELTDRLEKIGGLDDLTLVRATLAKHVTELKNNVEQMTRESQQMLAQLRARVTTYEDKLREVQLLVMRDELTGLANRRSVEERIQFNILSGNEFCVLMIDLNGFKQVNDRYGHSAGDDLLKQFAAELFNRSRVTDLVGRWGGDEFIVVFENAVPEATLYMRRIEEWVFGRYYIRGTGGKSTQPIEMTASIGLAGWNSGETMPQVIERADTAMYANKNAQRTAGIGGAAVEQTPQMSGSR
jgi:diguanylate cyclase (GGDEF)-like protein